MWMLSATSSFWSLSSLYHRNKPDIGQHGPSTFNHKNKAWLDLLAIYLLAWFGSFKTKRMRKHLCIFYLEHKTTDWKQSKINFLVSLQEPLLATVKRRKLAWLEHVRCHDSLSKTIVQGTLVGWWHLSQQKKCWMDNIKEWNSLPMPELLTRASCRKDWKRIPGDRSLVSPQQHNLPKDWTELSACSAPCKCHQWWPFSLSLL